MEDIKHDICATNGDTKAIATRWHHILFKPISPNLLYVWSSCKRSLFLSDIKVQRREGKLVEHADDRVGGGEFGIEIKSKEYEGYQPEALFRYISSQHYEFRE